MKKSIRLVTFATVSLLGTLWMQAQEFAVGNVEAKKGETVELPVSLNNGDVKVTSFQFDLYLPEGVTVELDEYDEPMVEAASARTDKYTVCTAAQQADGAYRFLLYSSKNNSIKGTEGVILTTNIILNAAPGDYTFAIKNAKVTESETFTKINCPETTASLTVKPIPAESITLDKTSIELSTTAGGTEQLTATVLPVDTTDKTVWSSSNEEVATVDENGVVTPKAQGTATITATCGSVSATCTATVKTETGIETLYADENGRQAEVFTLQGIQIASPVAPGVYIRRVGDKAEKMLVK